MSVRDVDPQQLILKAGERLKGMGMTQPDWARFVKTGASRERPPQQPDWWFIRGAAVLRQVYMEHRGVARLQRFYSGRKNLGHQPEHRALASGKILRTLLQQLEAAGLVKAEKRKGRVITPKGQQFLDQVAKEIGKAG